MKTPTIIAVLTVSLLSAGCHQKTKAPSSSPAAGPPVVQPVMVAWQQGNRSTAVSSFAQADWRSRPLFETGSTLSLNEEQFMALPEAERKARSEEMLSQLRLLKQLGSAVAQAGRDAASKGDTVQARKYFTSLKEFGTALNSPDCMRIVQLVGQAIQKMGDTELAKIAGSAATQTR